MKISMHDAMIKALLKPETLVNGQVLYIDAHGCAEVWFPKRGSRSSWELHELEVVNVK